MSKRSHDESGEPAESTCDDAAVDDDAVSEVRENASGAKQIRAIAETYAALGDPTRLRILEALSLRELCVYDLSEVVGVSQSAVSHQLRVLRQLDLVSYERDGKRAIYRLADDHVRTMLAQGAEHVAGRVGGESDE
jgi:DNA-binding transcriptional ArsR family regulator